ncbi:MAG: YciI family protein, partial [Sphingomonadales bacterium]
WKCASLEEAIDWVKRCPNPMVSDSEIEIRQIFGVEDFGPELTPALRAKEEELRERAGKS